MRWPLASVACADRSTQKLNLRCRLLDVGRAAGFCGLQKAPDGAIPLRAMLPFRPFQNECAGVSKRDEFLAALDFDDVGKRYRPAIAIPFWYVSQYAVARSAGLLKK